MTTNNSINTINLANFPANSLVGNLTGSSAPVAAVASNTFLPTAGFQIKYVSQDGNDTSGDGTVLHPYATVSKAMSVITTATSTAPFAIQVSGLITETTTLVLKPNISIYGSNAIISVTGTLNIDPSFLTTTSNQYYQNLVFTLTSNPTFDFSSAGASSHLARFYFNTILFTGAITFTIIGSLQESVNFVNCFNVASGSNITLTNISNGDMYACTHNALIIQNTTSTFARYQLVANTNFGSITIRGTSTGLMFCLARAINNSTNITVDGNASIAIDTVEAVPTLVNGATWNPIILYNSIKSTSNGGIFYSNATSMQLLSGTATANLPLLSGASTTPSWGAVSYLSSIATNAIVFGSATNTLSSISSANNGVLVTSGTGVPSISSTLPTGLAMQTPASLILTNATGLPIAGLSGLGTGVGTALGVNVGTAGSFVVNGGALGAPSSGTLTNATGLPLTTGVTGLLPLANGGTNANLTAANGAVPYSTGTAIALLAPTATANQLFMSGASGAPAWSTLTFPSTIAHNNLLYASAANQISAIAAASSAVLVTDASQNPSLSTTIPLITQRNITELNNITATFTLGGQLRTFCPAGGNIANSTTTGSFTPTIAFGGGTTGITYGSQNGRFCTTTMPDGTIRCDVWIQLSLTNKGGSTGAFTLTNLPLLSGTAAVWACPVATENTVTTAGSSIWAVVNSNALTANFYYFANNAAGVQMTNAHFQNTSTMRLYLTYWNTN